MRRILFGFAVGYFLVGILIIPPMLWALGIAPSYPKGMMIVAERSGVLPFIKSLAMQAQTAVDRKIDQVSYYVSARLIPREIDN